MALPDTWDKVKYFKPNSLTDNIGDPYKISDDLILKLDDFREFVGTKIIVTSGTRSTGKGKSYHSSMIDEEGFESGYCAVDIMLPEYDKSPFDLLMDAMRFNFSGLGYYSHWQFNGEVIGGLHLDTRPLKFDANGTLDYTNSRWMGVMDNGVQIYIPLTYENLIKYSYHGENLDSRLH